MRNIEVYQRRT